jgi:hypothetical protein
MGPGVRNLLKLVKNFYSKKPTLPGVVFKKIPDHPSPVDESRH